MGRHRIEEQDDRSTWGGPELLTGRDSGRRDAHAAPGEDTDTHALWPGETGRGDPREGSAR
ncbi:hypothetical protein [Amycolatopsis cihanbeyliensis]|uniref:Uncharacterized protein n=1 Tax=Amycolatopsis cihanbeyliensis TaxID=1128664 RepID=A0A542DBH2_AMYCI|nr:hypothetical protein [Amycolatopsis cihanbeyliensis]TQJ00414.1 hypothetical protein FB471_0035 [Amycolatopsis cihanbeyliensis]